MLTVATYVCLSCYIWSELVITNKNALHTVFNDYCTKGVYFRVFFYIFHLFSFETDLSLRAGESTESLSVYEEVTFSILATILKYIFHYFKREIMIGGS